MHLLVSFFTRELFTFFAKFFGTFAAEQIHVLKKRPLISSVAVCPVLCRVVVPAKFDAKNGWSNVPRNHT